MKTYLEQYIYQEFDHNYRAQLTSIAAGHRTYSSPIPEYQRTDSLYAVYDNCALSLKRTGSFFRRSASRFNKITANLIRAAFQD